MTLKVAFASCAKFEADPKQLAWRKINAHAPDLVLFLGDFVYSPMYLRRSHKNRWKKWNPKDLEDCYKQQFKEVDGLRELFEQWDLHATWDDHEFGPNNGYGAEAPKEKIERSRQLFHQYMVKGDAAQVLPNYPDIYHSFDRGDVRFIVLDGRYYRQMPSKKATMLGKKQREWFLEQLAHDQTYTVVCSGSTFTARSRFRRQGDRWKRYRNEYETIVNEFTKDRRVTFLGGDIHKNKFIPHDTFYEVISSGVARDGNENFGILTFGDEVTVELYDGDTLKKRHALGRRWAPVDGRDP